MRRGLSDRAVWRLGEAASSSWEQDGFEFGGGQFAIKAGRFVEGKGFDARGRVDAGFEAGGEEAKSFGAFFERDFQRVQAEKP
jgi:hypothetical protein